jgi:hypothetical protein
MKCRYATLYPAASVTCAQDCGGTITQMPSASGISSRCVRERTKPVVDFEWRNAVAQPETKNSRLSRQGEVSHIKGSSARDANGDLTCQSQVT